MIIVFACPVHGDLVEYDAPGPSQDYTPTSCWKYARAVGAVHAVRCNRLLERREESS